MIHKADRKELQHQRERAFTSKVNTLSMKDVNLKLAFAGKSLFQRATLMNYSVHNPADGNRAERRRVLREACSRKSIQKAIRKEELLRQVQQTER
jgi:hypothetical protein